ncbi:tRNA1(Val) (adenine(37)-N6)-methyltransferase [Pseudomonadota bacterium]
METSEDRILDGRVILNQPIEGYRAAVDPVLLAAAVRAQPGDRALDMGCGVGAAMLCLAARIDGLEIDGLEIQPELAELARQNVAANGFDDRIRVFEGNVAQPSPEIEEGAYAHVFANPPYMSGDRGNHSPNEIKRTADVEGEADLEDWVEAALKFCRPKGSVTFIYRADRLAEVMLGLSGKAGEITVFPLWPKEAENANRVIVRARKGIKTPMQLMNGLILHNADGSYTEAADAALKGGELRLRV